MDSLKVRTAVVGVGGAGCNVVSDIFWDMPSVDTIAVNTDRAAMENIDADRKMFICKSVTKGEGTKGDSMLGRRCAQAHMEEIREVLSEYDVVYIVAGMGGGTGTGAAPVIAEIAQGLDKVVSSILIDPFSFESSRTVVAKDGIARMRSVCPMTVVVENDLVLKRYPDSTMEDAFHAVNRSISSYIGRHEEKVKRSFSEQISNIGDLISDDKVPSSVSGKGIALN